jgi:hypothetical protein
MGNEESHHLSHSHPGDQDGFRRHVGVLRVLVPAAVHQLVRDVVS